MSEEKKQRLKEYQRNYREARRSTKLFYLYFFFNVQNETKSLELW